MLNKKPTSLSLSLGMENKTLLYCFYFIYQLVFSLLCCKAFTASHANIKEIHTQARKETHLGTHQPNTQSQPNVTGSIHQLL